MYGRGFFNLKNIIYFLKAFNNALKYGPKDKKKFKLGFVCNRVIGICRQMVDPKPSIDPLWTQPRTKLTLLFHRRLTIPTKYTLFG